MPPTYKKIKVFQAFPSRVKTRREWTWELQSSNGKVQAKSPTFFKRRWQAVRSVEDVVLAFRSALHVQYMKNGEVEMSFDIPQAVPKEGKSEKMFPD